MTTAELIKKKEEEKNNLSQSPNTSPFKPAEGMNMSEARMAGNGVSSSEIKADVPATGKTDNRVSLYEVGKNSGGTNIGEAEKMLKGNVSPIKTPEYEKFRNEVIGAQQFGVETPEQAAARERRDFIKQGLTGFTEGLSALANLYYTTKGAPSQKLTSQMPELSKRLYAERLERDRKLENFRAWMRDKARRDEDRAYQEKVTAETRAYQDAIRKEQADENRRRWEYTNQKQEEATAKADARYEAEQAYKREQDALANKHRAAQLAETQRYHDSLIANRGGKGSGTSVIHGKNGTSILNTKNGFMSVDWRKIDPKAERQLYDIIPEEIRSKYPLKEDEFSEYNEKYATSQMNAAIAEAAVTDEKIAKWLVDSKAGVYQQQEANPIHSNQQGSAQANEGQQNSGGSKWDSYDITDGKKTGTDFSKQKRPSQRGAAESSQMSNVSAASVPSAPATQSAPTDSGGNQFEAFFNRVDTARAEEKSRKDAELQADIRNREQELAGVRDTINQYQQELERLNAMSVPNAESEIKKRGLVRGDAKELKDMVKEYRRNKERIKKELKELTAKEKRLNKEYMELYPYKK